MNTETGKAKAAERIVAPEIVAKRKATMIERYGVENPYARPETKQRARIARAENAEARAEKWKEKFEDKWLDGGAITEIKDAQDGTCKRYSFTCSNGHTNVDLPWETLRWRKHRVGDPCSVCHPELVSGSIGEAEVMSFVTSLGELAYRTRNVIPPFELDVFIQSARIAIEYCGVYWHSEQAGMDKNYHLNKMNLCSEAAVSLLTIFEDEWLHSRTVCEKTISNMLGYGSFTDARKCSIDQEVPLQEARDFCNGNHIQGYAPCSYRIGLRNNTGTLVSLMTFAHPSIAKGAVARSDTWEISRMCSSIRVRGGASKMFSAFVSLVKPERVFTYADLRWGTGAVYEKIGFTRVANTSPGYWYVERGTAKRIHRFALRKGVRADDDPALTEFENRDRQGYLRIWDCGHAKYEWSSLR